jgi:hypothetical protein
MSATVRLLTEEECDRLECYRPTAYEGANLAQLARWAAKAHAWLHSARLELTHLDTCQVWSDDKDDTVCTCGLVALLAEITTPTEEKDE